MSGWTPVVQVWDATGATPLGVIRAVERITVSDVLSGVALLQFSAPASTPGMEHVLTDDDRQLRVLIPGGADQWYLLDEDRPPTVISDDPDGEVVEVTCRGLAAVLDEAVVLPAGGVGATPAEASWTSPTPGAVLADLFAAAQARGLLQGVTLAGGALLDAAGVPWPATAPDTTWTAGTSLARVLDGLTAAGLVEWRMAGRVLELHRPGGALDRTPAGVVLRPGRDVEAAPVARSRRAVATAVLVEGAGEATARRTQTLPGRRAREQFVQQDRAGAGVLGEIGDLWLAAHAAAEVQVTHTLTDGPDSPRPWVDIRPGDRVPTLAVGAQVQLRRIAQLSLEVDADGARVTLELGSLLAGAEERLVRELRRLAPGEASLT